MSIDSRLHRLDDDRSSVPDARSALREPDGCWPWARSFGAAPARCLRHGIFPWFFGRQPILWWSPDPRTLFPHRCRICRAHASRAAHYRHGRCARTHRLRRGDRRLRCSVPPRSTRYLDHRRHARGVYGPPCRRHAHSVEGSTTAPGGGIYGSPSPDVLGESMFSAKAGARRSPSPAWPGACALGMALIDAQCKNDHLLTWAPSRGRERASSNRWSVGRPARPARPLTERFGSLVARELAD